MKGRAFAFLTVDGDVSFMRIDDILDNFRPKPGSSLFPTHGLESEQIISDFWGHSPSCISHG